MSTKPPRKESYRVTFVRPDGWRAEDVRKAVENSFGHLGVQAKVELIRGSAQAPKPWWKVW